MLRREPRLDVDISELQLDRLVPTSHPNPSGNRWRNETCPTCGVEGRVFQQPARLRTAPAEPECGRRPRLRLERGPVSVRPTCAGCRKAAGLAGSSAENRGTTSIEGQSPPGAASLPANQACASVSRPRQSGEDAGLFIGAIRDQGLPPAAVICSPQPRGASRSPSKMDCTAPGLPEAPTLEQDGAS